MRGMRAKIDYILKHNLAIQKIYKIVIGSFIRFLGVFVKTNERMVLFNAHGRKYNDSPKVIFEKMIVDPRFKDFELVWALDFPDEYEISGCSKVKMDTMRYFITALKAKYWISCVNIERGLHFKKKNTVYLNTWHGTPLKYIGNAVKGRKDFDFSTIDLFCCAGKYEKDIYIKDFNVSEKAIIFSGLPRNDYLYNSNEHDIHGLRKKLKLPENKKVILYAPTWRDSKDIGKNYSLKPPIDFLFWQECLHDDYVILLRAHAYTNLIVGIEFNDFIRDFSSYPDINDLLLVSDILISDYSATIFDYSILGKPILCFGYDYNDYSLERGLYIDLEVELPSGVIKTEKELMSKVLTLDYFEEGNKVKKFKSKYIEYGGNATNLCLDELLCLGNK